MGKSLVSCFFLTHSVVCKPILLFSFFHFCLSLYCVLFWRINVYAVIPVATYTSSARRPAPRPLRASYTNRLNPENN